MKWLQKAARCAFASVMAAIVVMADPMQAERWLVPWHGASAASEAARSRLLRTPAGLEPAHTASEAVAHPRGHGHRR